MTPGAQRRLVAAVPATLTAAALSAPLLGAFGYTLSAFAILQFFSVVCHQDPSRSFWIAGAPVAMCARCIGICMGAIAGAVARVPRRRALAVLMAAAGVNLLDYLAEIAGLHGNWPLLRFSLGGVLGTGLSALVAASLPRLLPRDS